MIIQYKGIIHRISGAVLVLLLFSPALVARPRVWTLKDCIEQAWAQNIALNQSQLNNRIYLLNYDQSQYNKLPTLNLGDAQSQDFGRYLNPANNQYTTQNAATNSLSLTGSVTLYNGSRITNQVKQNKLTLESGNLDIETQKNNLALSVLAAYTQVLYYYEAIKIDSAQIEVSKEHLDYTTKNVNAGAQAESAILQMQAQLATDRTTKINDENQLALAKVTLMQYMELPLDNTDFEIDRPQEAEIAANITRSPAEIYKIAEDALPDAKSAMLKTDASRVGILLAQSEIKPKLTLSGSLSTYYSSAASLLSYQSSTQIENIGYLESNPAQKVDGPVTSTYANNEGYPFFNQFRDNFGQGLSLNLSVPIFNNMAYKTDIKRARFTADIAKLNENLVKNQLRKNIESAYTDQVSAAKSYQATGVQLAFEERNFHDFEIKFKAGMINATDYFVEKGNYAKALQAHLSAKYQWIFKTKVVEFYSGNPLTQ